MSEPPPRRYANGQIDGVDTLFTYLTLRLIVTLPRL